MARVQHRFIFPVLNPMPVLSAFETMELPLQLANYRADAIVHAWNSHRAWWLGRPDGPSPERNCPAVSSAGAIARAIVTDPTILVCDEP